MIKWLFPQNYYSKNDIWLVAKEEYMIVKDSFFFIFISISQ